MRLLIFDLDGTLIDSKLDLAVAVNATRASLHLQPMDEERIYSYVGEGAALLRNSRSRRTGPRSSSASVHALRSWHSKLRHPVQHSALDRGFYFLVLDRAGREAYPEYRLVP